MRFSKGRTGAILALVLLGGAIGQGSSHREAPGITKTPKLDGTDFYMFRSYETGRSGFVTLVANYMPLQDPYGGPNYFTLDTAAVYEIHIDNNADAVEDLTFQFRPSVLVKDLSVAAGNMLVPVPLINIGQIGPNAGDTSALNREETFAVNIIRGDRRNGVGPGHHERGRRRGDFPQARGQHRRQVHPELRDLRQQPHLRHRHPRLRQRARCSSVSARTPSSSTSAKPSISSTSATLSDAENAEADDLADKNVTSFVLEVPIACLVSSASQPIIGGWTTASLGVGRSDVTGRARRRAPRAAGGASADRRSGIEVGAGPELLRLGAGQPSRGARRSAVRRRQPAAPGTQVSRLGAPLVNEVVIGLQRQGPVQLGVADPGLRARGLRDQPDAAGAARDPLRRRRRSGAEQLPAPRSGGGVPHRHSGPQPAGQRRRV